MLLNSNKRVMLRECDVISFGRFRELLAEYKHWLAEREVHQESFASSAFLCESTKTHGWPA